VHPIVRGHHPWTFDLGSSAAIVGQHRGISSEVGAEQLPVKAKLAATAAVAFFAFATAATVLDRSAGPGRFVFGGCPRASGTCAPQGATSVSPSPASASPTATTPAPAPDPAPTSSSTPKASQPPSRPVPATSTPPARHAHRRHPSPHPTTATPSPALPTGLPLPLPTWPDDDETSSRPSPRTKAAGGPRKALAWAYPGQRSRHGLHHQAAHQRRPDGCQRHPGSPGG
jgi:hypothetical protein